MKEEGGRTGGNKRGDVTQGSGVFFSFFGFLLESFSLFLGLFSAFFPLPLILSLFGGAG